ncbi:MAG: hypothetical protein EP343_04345 [Deltaproteobacteria bacterium]|nr:MAG: hypothetical protein EP343_04345 [Deltaproteobacteria bacterium]
MRTKHSVGLVFLGLWLLGASPGSPTSRPTIRPPQTLPTLAHQGFRQTETLLRLLMQGKYAAALQQMNPTIRSALSPQHLKKQHQRVFATLGAYRLNSLTLHSRVSLRGNTRYIWYGQFTKEKGTILILFDAQHRISGFVIQSPSLLRQQQREASADALGARLRAQLQTQVNTLLQGYNQNQWAAFCKHCNKVMKQLLAPPKFKTLQSQLMKRYGRYLSRRLFSVKRLSAMKQTFVFRYVARFSRNAKVRMQFVFRRKEGQYRIASWQLR